MSISHLKRTFEDAPICLSSSQKRIYAPDNSAFVAHLGRLILEFNASLPHSNPEIHAPLLDLSNDSNDQTFQRLQKTLKNQRKIPPLNVKASTPWLADTLLQSAKKHLESGKLEAAQTCVNSASKYIGADRYAELPPLFVRVGEAQKGALAYLQLAHLYLQQDLVDPAIEATELALENMDKETGQFTAINIFLTSLKPNLA
jgi:hypothetical protein